MKTKDERSLLKEKIIGLENRQKEELQLLKKAITNSFDNMMPINILMSAVGEFTSSIDIKEHLINLVKRALQKIFTKTNES